MLLLSGGKKKAEWFNSLAWTSVIALHVMYFNLGDEFHTGPQSCLVMCTCWKWSCSHALSPSIDSKDLSSSKAHWLCGTHTALCIHFAMWYTCRSGDWWSMGIKPGAGKALRMEMGHWRWKSLAWESCSSKQRKWHVGYKRKVHGWKS